MTTQTTLDAHKDPHHVEILAQRRSQRAKGLRGPSGGGAGNQPKRFITIDDICADLEVSRSTYYDWRAKNKAPLGKKLPNGSIRIAMATYEAWLESLEEDR